MGAGGGLPGFSNRRSGSVGGGPLQGAHAAHRNKPNTTEPDPKGRGENPHNT